MAASGYLPRMNAPASSVSSPTDLLPAAGLVHIVGTSASGKTELALAVLHTLSAEREGLRCAVLGTQPSLAVLTPRLPDVPIMTMSLPRSCAADIADAVGRLIGDTRIDLLVIDDLDEILHPPALNDPLADRQIQMHALLEACGALADGLDALIVVTSSIRSGAGFAGAPVVRNSAIAIELPMHNVRVVCSPRDAGGSDKIVAVVDASGLGTRRAPADGTAVHIEAPALGS
jgi:hypothetical protein